MTNEQELQSAFPTFSLYTYGHLCKNHSILLLVFLLAGCEKPGAPAIAPALFCGASWRKPGNRRLDHSVRA